MDKHSQGPWRMEAGKTNGAEHGAWGAVIGGEPEYIVATVWADVAELKKQAEANARLLSAAPELLEALRKIVSEGDYTAPEDMKRIARAAIAKASGVQS